MSWTICCSTIKEKGVHSAATKLFKYLKLVGDAIFVHVETIVTEADHTSSRCAENKAICFRNGVFDFEELCLKVLRNAYLVAWLHNVKVEFRCIYKLLMPLLHNCLGELRSIDD